MPTDNNKTHQGEYMDKVYILELVVPYDSSYGTGLVGHVEGVFSTQQLAIEATSRQVVDWKYEGTDCWETGQGFFAGGSSPFYYVKELTIDEEHVDSYNEDNLT